MVAIHSAGTHRAPPVRLRIGRILSFPNLPERGLQSKSAQLPSILQCRNRNIGIIADAGHCEPSGTNYCTTPRRPIRSSGSVSSTLACGCIASGLCIGLGSQQAPDGGAACPARRPLAGDGCTTEGLWCLSGDSCTGATFRSVRRWHACVGYSKRLDVSHLALQHLSVSESVSYRQRCEFIVEPLACGTVRRTEQR